MLIITVVFEEFDDNNGRKEMAHFLFFEYGGDYSNIMKSPESIKWTALQTCDKNEGRQREAKPTYHH